MDSVPVWPEWMPVPARSSYGFESVDRTLETGMEIGGVKRVLFDTDETHINVTVHLNPEQRLWFQSFERETLKHGTNWFELPVLVTEGVERYKVRIIGRPKFGNFVGHPSHCQTTFSVQIEKRKLLDGGMLGLLEEISPADIRALNNVLHPVLHIQMPGITNYNVIEPDELIVVAGHLHTVLYTQMPGITNYI